MEEVISMKNPKLSDLPITLEFKSQNSPEPVPFYKKAWDRLAASGFCLRTPNTSENQDSSGLSAIIAKFGTMPAGSLTFKTIPEESLIQVELVFVEPLFRQKGIGRALLESLDSLAHPDIQGSSWHIFATIHHLNDECFLLFLSNGYSVLRQNDFGDYLTVIKQLPGSTSKNKTQ